MSSIDAHIRACEAKGHVTAQMKPVCVAVEWFATMCPAKQCGMTQRIYGTTTGFQNGNPFTDEYRDYCCEFFMTSCQLNAFALFDTLTRRDGNREEIEIIQSVRGVGDHAPLRNVMSMIEEQEVQIQRKGIMGGAPSVFVHHVLLSLNIPVCHHFLLVGSEGQGYVLYQSNIGIYTLRDFLRGLYVVGTDTFSGMHAPLGHHHPRSKNEWSRVFERVVTEEGMDTFHDLFYGAAVDPDTLNQYSLSKIGIRSRTVGDIADDERLAASLTSREGDACAIHPPLVISAKPSHLHTADDALAASRDEGVRSRSSVPPGSSSSSIEEDDEVVVCPCCPPALRWYFDMDRRHHREHID